MFKVRGSSWCHKNPIQNGGIFKPRVLILDVTPPVPPPPKKNHLGTGLGISEEMWAGCVQSRKIMAIEKSYIWGMKLSFCFSIAVIILLLLFKWNQQPEDLHEKRGPAVTIQSLTGVRKSMNIHLGMMRNIRILDIWMICCQDYWQNWVSWLLSLSTLHIFWFLRTDPYSFEVRQMVSRAQMPPSHILPSEALPRNQHKVYKGVLIDREWCNVP